MIRQHWFWYWLGAEDDLVYLHKYAHGLWFIIKLVAWWRHQMKTFSTLLAICVGNSPVSGEFPAQRPVTRSFDVFFDVRIIKRLSKHSLGWWFETLSHPLWRHRNVVNDTNSPSLKPWKWTSTFCIALTSKLNSTSTDVSWIWKTIRKF